MNTEKRIKLGVLILGCVVLCFFLWAWREEEARRALLEAKSQAYEKTEKQVRILEDEIVQAEKELQKMERKGFVCLAFRESNPRFQDTILPLMREYGWTGILILPFDEEDRSGEFTDEEIRELSEEGWEIAVGGKAEELIQKEELLTAEKEGNAIRGFFFDKGDYQYHKKIYEILETIGCRYSCPFGIKEEVIRTQNTSSLSIVECQNFSMDKTVEEIEDLLLQVEEAGVSVVFTDYAETGTWESWEMETPDYSEVFRILQEKVKTGNLRQGNFQDCTTYVQEWESEKEEKEKEFQQFREEQERKIEEIRKTHAQ